MDKKYGKSSSKRVCRPRKRQFSGNRFSDESDSNLASTSAEKIVKTSNLSPSTDPTFSYCIVQFLVFTTLQQKLKCKVCDGDVKFFKRDERGVGFKLCVVCDCGDTLIDSSPKIGKSYEINRRFIFVMRLLGCGLAGVNNFCGLMDLGTGFYETTYYKIIENIKIAVEAVFRVVINEAANEEKDKNKAAGNKENELSVSGDGSWAKRGFTSLLGIVSLIGKYSNKILDVIVKSSFCHACRKWKGKENSAEFEAFWDEHEEHCSANHKGSAGKMEVDGVLEMFQRSEDLHDAKYKYYIGDGDTKTFTSILDMQPYGDDFVIEKKECVLHVKKRMYRRVKEAKKVLTQTRKQAKKENPTPKKKRSEPKKIQLTNKLMQDLSLYYGLAIRRHPDSVEEMKKEIWSTFYHKISTDEKPQHMYCPPGAESWCKWRKHEAAGTLSDFKHPPPLDDDIQQVLKSIYEDLTADDLLKRCLGNNTQNNNESFNSCVWHLAPKHIFCGKKIIEIATYTSACIFNEGFTAVLKIMDVMGTTIGPAAAELARKRDEARIRDAERNLTDAAREARIARRDERALENEAYEESEGILYAAGIAD